MAEKRQIPGTPEHRERLEYQRAWKQSHPHPRQIPGTPEHQAQLEYQRAWRASNREWLLERERAWRKANPEKVRERKRRYEVAHPDNVRARKRRYAARNPEKIKLWQKRHWIKKKYGLTVEQYEALTSGPCAICGCVGERIHLDHCHSTDRIRGGLCGRCNRGLGMFDDDPARLQLAAAYLR